MSVIERFRSSLSGGIEFTGNSLVVSKKISDSENVSNLCAFISKDSEKSAKGFPGGTTEDFLQNSSSAVLNLPKGSEIIYAELIWGGSYKAKNLGLTEPIINSSVKFTLPNGTTVMAVPDSITRFDSLLFERDGVYNYIRSSQVTKWVKECGAGSYTVGSVPAYINSNDGTIKNFAAAGWTLAVIYKSPNPMAQKKYICFYVGNLTISDDTREKGIAFRGFPNELGKNGSAKLLLSAAGGNFYLPGNKVFFSCGGKKHPLSTENNKEDHFFSSNINTDCAFPDTSGTFGDLKNCYGSLGWDITKVSINKYIEEPASSGIVKFSSSGNPYCVNAAAISIDIKNSKKGSENMIKTAVLSETPIQETTAPAKQLFSQLMLERLYSYGIKSITDCKVQYNSANVFEFNGEKVLSCNYTIFLSYKDVLGKNMNSVKSGTVTFLNVTKNNIENCSVRINRVSAKIEKNQVLIKAIVKVMSL